jgi:integrase/recombinase XerC
VTLSLYRRHNKTRCTSIDTQHCDSKRKPCPIWIRGFLEIENRYVRQQLGTRDWTKATDEVRSIEAGLMKLDTVAQSARPAAPRITVLDWHTEYIKNARVENISQETIRKYETLFRQLEAFAADKGYRYPSDLDLEALQAFRGTWKDAARSKAKKQERLRSIFKFAVKRRWLTENLSLDLGRIKTDDAQQVPFSESEMKKILEEARKVGPEVYTFILVLRFSGLRISDVAMLNVAALQGEHLVLRTAKTGADVKVLLPKIVAGALRKIKRRHPDYFFWNGTSKLQSVTDYWRSRQIKPIFKAAKLSSAHPHQFRHTFAVELLKQGTSTTHVADLLGNSEKIVKKHYSAWTVERQKNLDEVVRKANGYHSLKGI